jgi:hypothetical protein
VVGRGFPSGNGKGDLPDAAQRRRAKTTRPKLRLSAAESLRRCDEVNKKKAERIILPAP